jgi:hypothetical protein
MDNQYILKKGVKSIFNLFVKGAFHMFEHEKIWTTFIFTGIVFYC